MAIVGPIPLFSNPPIEPQYFAPWTFTISNIALGASTLVTMVIPPITMLNYVIGQQVRLLIPPTFGCRELNGLTGYVISIPSVNQVVIDINSIGMTPYIASPAATPAQISAIGDISSGPTNMTRQSTSTVIPGSFINISPN